MEILRFWFGDGNSDAGFREHEDRWWRKDARLDAEVRERFAPAHERAMQGGCEAWRAHPGPCLALVILLDQFSRNMFRGTPEMFASDARAQGVALGAIDSGHAEAFEDVRRLFLYMPLMHAESRDLQQRSLDLFAEACEHPAPALADAANAFQTFAEHHAAIIDRFGRFPHRNAILGRQSTPEEEAFLNEPGSRF